MVTKYKRLTINNKLKIHNVITNTSINTLITVMYFKLNYDSILFRLCVRTSTYVPCTGILLCHVQGYDTVLYVPVYVLILIYHVQGYGTVL